MEQLLLKFEINIRINNDIPFFFNKVLSTVAINFNTKLIVTHVDSVILSY